MSSSSLRTVVGLGNKPYERLYYGYSTVTGLVRTGLQTAVDIPSALAKEDGYGEGDFDIEKLVEYATKHWKPTADISKNKVGLAQRAIAAFSQGDDTSIEAKVALFGFREFAADCIFSGWRSYPQEESRFILSSIDRGGLSTGLLERTAEGDTISTFMSEDIRGPSYVEEAQKVILEHDRPLYCLDTPQREERRVVAAAEFVTSMSLAVGALYAASCEGKMLEGLVAERLNPLLGI